MIETADTSDSDNTVDDDDTLDDDRGGAENDDDDDKSLISYRPVPGGMPSRVKVKSWFGGQWVLLETETAVGDISGGKGPESTACTCIVLCMGDDGDDDDDALRCLCRGPCGAVDSDITTHG